MFGHSNQPIFLETQPSHRTFITQPAELPFVPLSIRFLTALPRHSATGHISLPTYHFQFLSTSCLADLRFPKLPIQSQPLLEHTDPKSRNLRHLFILPNNFYPKRKQNHNYIPNYPSTPSFLRTSSMIALFSSLIHRVDVVSLRLMVLLKLKELDWLQFKL